MQAVPTTFEDEKVVEHFFQFALQTDYMHGRLSPRLVAMLDPSGIFGFVVTATYRLTDYLLLSSVFMRRGFAADGNWTPSVTATMVTSCEDLPAQLAGFGVNLDTSRRGPVGRA